MGKNKRFLAAILFLSSTILWAATNILSDFDKSDPGSTEIVNHQAFQDILNTYVDDNDPSGINRFDYSKVTSSDKKKLKDYLSNLSTIKVTTLNKDEQMAYWINMYNALTIDVILDNYPVKSIKNIKSGFFTSGPWDLKLTAVEGIKLSLNEIEHSILRPIWKDKRIHYSVNCASLGCPNLSKTVYSAANLDEMLNSAATAYINHPRGVKIENNKLILSSIYKWYKKDFGTTKDLLGHLSHYAKGTLKNKLINWSGPIKYSYNWNLNAPDL